jgi:hypothetical protein
MRSLTSTIVLLSLLGCTAEEDKKKGSSPPPSKATAIPFTQGGTAASPDSQFAVIIAANELTENATVTIREGLPSPAPAVTHGKVYEITVAPASAVPAGSFNATLAWELASLPNADPNDLMALSGNTPGEGITDELFGAYNATDDTFEVAITHFSYYVMVDETDYMSCGCNETAACDTGCNFCDADCDAPACQCDTDASCTGGCDCDEDCGGICECDVTSGSCDSLCDCDPDCFVGCDCDVSPWCDMDCTCDSWCSECPCDYDDLCSEGCGCDMQCSSTGNDCTGGITITGASGSASGTTSGGSTMAGSCISSTATSPDVLYTWTAPSSGAFQFSTCSGATWDTVVYALDGLCTEIACNDDSCSVQSSIVVEVTSGQIVHIVVDGFGDQGSYTMTWGPI